MKKRYIDQNNHYLYLPYKVRIKPLLAALCLFFLLITTAQATIWRVNNDIRVDSDFTSLSAAYSAASAGDMLYIEGSLLGYTSPALNKPLTLIGSGYFLEENQPDTTRMGLINATLVNLSIDSTAKGAVIMGLEIYGQINITNADSIKILRNKIGRLAASSCHALLIAQNYIHNGSGSYGSSNYTIYLSNCRNVNIFNNIISRVSVSRSNYYNLHSSSSNVNVIIKNNLLRGYNITLQALVFNNILYSGTFSNSISYFNTFWNNISHSTSFGTSDGNLANVPMSTVFTQSSQSPDKYYELKAGSPAIEAGKNGEDMGPFGGDDPYRLSGIVPLPSIFNVEIMETGSPVMQLDVTFKAKSNR